MQVCIVISNHKRYPQFSHHGNFASWKDRYVDESREKWESYIERLEQYFLANDVDNGKKIPVLLSVIGGPTYSLLKDLNAPDKPANKTYQEIVDVLKNHLSPKSTVKADKFRFHKKDQRPDESVRDFINQLRKLS
jgi:hypothetical protein